MENLKQYNIWSEGFRTNGEASGAFFIGTSLGSNFKEACDNFAIKDANFKKYYSSNDLTYWGCKLFDNETDARVNFG